MRNKKKALVLSSLAVVTAVALLFGGATLAYRFAQTGNIQNLFTPGTVSMDVQENSSSTPSDTNELPDGTKEVQLQNTGTIESYLRAKLVPSWKFVDGEANTAGLVLRPMPETITGTVVDLGDIRLHLAADWQTNWLYKDGYFYYKKPVPAGDMTTLLMESVSVAEGKEATLLNKLQLDVLSESIQTSDPQDTQPALQQAWGPLTLDSNGCISG